MQLLDVFGAHRVLDFIFIAIFSDYKDDDL